MWTCWANGGLREQVGDACPVYSRNRLPWEAVVGQAFVFCLQPGVTHGAVVVAVPLPVVALVVSFRKRVPWEFLIGSVTARKRRVS